MKRAVALLLLVFLLFASANAAEKNLLPNGSFEALTASGEPVGWYQNAYRTQEGYSRLAVSNSRAHSGQYSVVIENASRNDARYICTVAVEPESLYRLSGYVLVESMQDVGNGANFGIEDLYASSEGVFDTDSDWHYLEWYGETGEKQKELTFGVRVGGYSAESVGKAYFDDIVLEKVEALPDDVIADIWYSVESPAAEVAPSSVDETAKKTEWFLLLGMVFVCLLYFLRPLLGSASSKAANVGVVILMLAALILRVVLAASVPGYEVDINCFTAWSVRMAQNGPAGFYAPDYFCDYPPGAMLLLWPIGWLLGLTGYGNAASLLVVKSLPILCDLLGACYLYLYGRRHISNVAAAAVSAMLLLNPAVLVNGACWGQMDSVLALLMLLTAIAAMQRNWDKAIPLFVVAALTKPQALLFAPIGGMWLLFGLAGCRKDQAVLKKEGKQIAFGLGWAILAALAIILPFSVRQEKPFAWLFELYAETLSSYAYATLNTANLYYLIGANWVGLTKSVSHWLPVAASICFAGAGAALLLKPLPDRKKTRAVSAFLFAAAAVQLVLWDAGCDYALYGYVMMALVYAFAILTMAYDHNPGSLPFYMSLALMGVYVLGVKIHERYLFPALLLLLLSYTRSRDRRLLWLCAGFSATTFVNTAIVLENSILFGAAQGHLNADTQAVNILLCITNLLLYAGGCWIGMTGLRASADEPSAEKTERRTPASYFEMLLHPSDYRLHLNWRDILLLSAVTVGYAVLAFTNLGSTLAPQTAWVSTAADEEVVLETEESSTFSVQYYAGVSYYPFAVSVSEDGVNWSEPYPCEMREGLCYRWNYAVTSTPTEKGPSFNSQAPQNVLWLNGKYLRIHATQAGLNLWEVVACDQNGNILPLRISSHSGGKADWQDESKPASNLIDEQDTYSGPPSWYNGTYFDEIYHARTAYEHLHGLRPYETTHPPLGKLLMSVGIAVFGMTPFGWRFAGAFVGVLMLPALYLLALQLTHKKRIAAISMLAFALDLMHYAQTRIATIDSFPVLFILLSYLFMVRYMQMDAFETEMQHEPVLFGRCYRKTLLPLFFSGVFMGLSIASKWIGVYSAIGLAVLFFLTMYRHWRASDAAFELEGQNAAEAARIQTARDFTLKRCLITCGFCLLFFVLIPCCIYFLSYVPYLAPSGPVTLERVIAAQEGMLAYHSTPGLGMDHPFQSPWWQWPFILKPMWFAQDSFEPVGYASTIMCLGNPWVFYLGAFAMLGVMIGFVCKYLTLQNGRLTLRHGDGNLTLAILTIGFLAQYLPWVLVPRSMYIYHYFASVPFIIMATAWFLDSISRPRLRSLGIAVYLAGALVFFVLFFPYASGWLTSTEWLDAMKWFSRLYY